MGVFEIITQEVPPTSLLDKAQACSIHIATNLCTFGNKSLKLQLKIF